MRIGIDCRTALARKTGDRTYTLNLLRGLAELAARDEVPDGWTFHLLLDRPDEVGVLPSSPRFETRVLTAPNGRLWTLLALPLYARENRLDLVHVQYLAPRLSCRFVTTVHDAVWRAMPQTFPLRDRILMNLLMPNTVRRASRVLTVSESSKRDIARFLRVPNSKIHVTPNAVDPAFLAPVTPHRIAEVCARYGLGDAPYVLSLGVLQPRKNVPRLIEAFAHLKRIHPNWPHRLVVTGKQGWGETLGRREPWLIETGYVEDDELPALYAGADVFAYPSLYEGFGLPIVEAMACGAPVLTSNRGAMREVAGEAAELVNPTSIDSIADGLERVLSDDARRQELRQRGFERAREFTPEKQARATLDEYLKAFEAQTHRTS